MNYVNDVLKMLGVEIGEEFKIRNEKGVIVSHTYSINDELIVYKNVNGTRTRTSDVYFGEFLLGNLEIVKIPFKPKYGEIYYYFDGDVFNNCWTGSDIDFMFFKLGNCFRTKEEAEIEGKKIIDRLRKEYGDC